MKPRILIGSLLVLLSIAFGVTAFKQSLTPYISFAEARRSGTSVQVNGVLADPTRVRYDAGRSELVFALKDDKNEVMDVVYKGVKPVNFEMATNVVAIGTTRTAVSPPTSCWSSAPRSTRPRASRRPRPPGPRGRPAPAATPASTGGK
jgi:cytochrome c-type biogenesis protein CcmE